MNYLIVSLIVLCVLTICYCESKLREKEKKIFNQKIMIERRNEKIEEQLKRIKKQKTKEETLDNIKIVINSKGTIVDKFDLIEELVNKAKN